MAKFLFSLETLLRHREDTEQREKDELSRINYRHQTELQHRDGLNLKFRETMTELAQEQSRHADPMELYWFYLYINRLTLEIGESGKRLANLEAEAQAQKAVVVEASKKRKVLSSLKAKKQKEFTLELQRQEQKEVDDLVVTRYVSREPERPDRSESSKSALLTRMQF